MQAWLSMIDRISSCFPKWVRVGSSKYGSKAGKFSATSQLLALWPAPTRKHSACMGFKRNFHDISPDDLAGNPMCCPKPVLGTSASITCRASIVPQSSRPKEVCQLMQRDPITGKAQVAKATAQASKSQVPMHCRNMRAAAHPSKPCMTRKSFRSLSRCCQSAWPALSSSSLTSPR